jgi:hypothetical protein
MLDKLKQFKSFIMAGLVSLVLMIGAVLWRNRGEASPAATKAIAEDKSKEIVQKANEIQSTNTSIAEKQEAVVQAAKPVIPSQSRKLEDALKEWNKRV